MCDTCGCGNPAQPVTFRIPGELQHSHLHSHKHEDGPDHTHDHDHGHHHHHDDYAPNVLGRSISMEQDVLSKNNLLAERNRGFFEARHIFAINLLSSPGSGKTTLLEQTITNLKDEIIFSVIEGDQQSMRDADRISATGCPVIQVNTGNGCHLDAQMINHAIKELNLTDHSVLMIENVGNLVCPSLFELGEAHKVVIISVTEGEDKPLKYPTMFSVSDICIINKIDLLPYVDFDVQKCKEYARAVNHHLQFFEVSAKTGEGLAHWYDWLKKQIQR